MKNKKLKPKTIKSIKTIAITTAFLICVAGWAEYLFTDVATASAPYERMNNTFPIAQDVKAEKLPVRERAIFEARLKCRKHTLGQSCVNDILGMAYVETKFKPQEIGDSGNSYGLFQIHRGYHPEITVEQARDISFATEWTLNRLLHYGYPEYRSIAIRKHNGSPTNPKTKVYLDKVNSFALN